MNLNNCPILHLAGSGSGKRSSFRKAATHVPAFADDWDACRARMRPPHTHCHGRELSLTREEIWAVAIIHGVDQKFHEMLGRLEGVFREKSVTTHKEHVLITLINLPLVSFWTLERSESLARMSQRTVSHACDKETQASVRHTYNSKILVQLFLSQRFSPVFSLLHSPRP